MEAAWPLKLGCSAARIAAYFCVSVSVPVPRPWARWRVRGRAWRRANRWRGVRGEAEGGAPRDKVAVGDTERVDVVLAVAEPLSA